MKMPEGWESLKMATSLNIDGVYLYPREFDYAMDHMKEMTEIIEQLLDEGNGGAISFDLYIKADDFYKKFKEWK